MTDDHDAIACRDTYIELLRWQVESLRALLAERERSVETAVEVARGLMGAAREARAPSPRLVKLLKREQRRANRHVFTARQRDASRPERG